MSDIKFTKRPESKEALFHVVVTSENIEQLEELMETSIDIVSDENEKFTLEINLSDLTVVELLLVAPDNRAILKKYSGKASKCIENLHLIGPVGAKEGADIMMSIIRNNGLMCNVTCEVR